MTSGIKRIRLSSNCVHSYVSQTFCFPSKDDKRKVLYSRILLERVPKVGLVALSEQKKNHWIHKTEIKRKLSFVWFYQAYCFISFIRCYCIVWAGKREKVTKCCEMCLLKFGFVSVCTFESCMCIRILCLHSHLLCVHTNLVSLFVCRRSMQILWLHLRFGCIQIVCVHYVSCVCNQTLFVHSDFVCVRSNLVCFCFVKSLVSDDCSSLYSRGI